MCRSLFFNVLTKVRTATATEKQQKTLKDQQYLICAVQTLSVYINGYGWLQNQSSNLGSDKFIQHSLSCTMPNCTVLIKQEVVATLNQLACPTFTIVCPSQQSQWVKPPNDSPGRPLVPMAASGAGSSPGGKMIGKKKRCRSAQTRHLFFFFF